VEKKNLALGIAKNRRRVGERKKKISQTKCGWHAKNLWGEKISCQKKKEIEGEYQRDKSGGQAYSSIDETRKN